MQTPSKLTLNRTDLARAAVQQILDDLDRRERELHEAEQRAARAFAHEVRRAVLYQHGPQWEELCRLADTDPGRLDAKPLLELYDDALVNPPDTVDVRVADGNSYDCRVQIRLRLAVEGSVRAALDEWVRVTRAFNEVAAEHRSVKAQDAKARARMVEDALRERESGRRVLEALSEFKADLKANPPDLPAEDPGAD